jgi:hypothetical protein
MGLREMSQAIWTLLYGVKHARESEYLDWFHTVHVAEKLSRPGYGWASHYEVVSGCGEASAETKDKRYIALFGGGDTSVFYNPSPAQLAANQSAETRDMMSCRVSGRGIIFAAEWSADGQGVIGETKPAIDADMISLSFCDTNENDEDFCAWLIQEQLNATARDADCIGVRKLLASSGGPRHAVIQERSKSAPPATPNDAGDAAWRARVEDYVTYPWGPAQTAKRVWPPSS